MHSRAALVLRLALFSEFKLGMTSSSLCSSELHGVQTVPIQKLAAQ